MSDTHNHIDRGLELYRELILEDPQLSSEYEASAPAYFRGRVPVLDPRQGAEESSQAQLATRRHLEWFLFERHSEELRSLPAETLQKRWALRAAPEESDMLEGFLGSLAGIFEVTAVQPEEGVWLHDLAGFGEYPVDDHEIARVLEVGDLVVGRLFPLGNSLHRVSRAAGVFRNRELSEALKRDLERARAGRRGVLRLAQIELEAMFWGGRQSGGEGALSRARAFFLGGGLEAEQVEAIFAELTSEPFDTQGVTPGMQDSLSSILDRLAFETTIDLEAARRHLFQAWQSLSQKGPGHGPHLEPAAPTGPPSKAEVRAAVRDFEAGRAAGEDLERLFGELERRLALVEEPEHGESDESQSVPDFPGVVGAMVEELIWETQQEQGEKSGSELAILRHLGLYASHIGVFENLTAKDLLVFSAYWLPESDELSNAEDAQRLLVALRRFCRWAEERHQLLHIAEFRATLAELSSSLPRAIEANRRRTRKTEPAEGELFELLSIDERARGAVRDRGGDEHQVEVDADLATWLRTGDRLRGRLEDGRMAVYCCYPPEAAGIAAGSEADTSSSEERGA